VLRALERIDSPVRRLVVSVPLGRASLDLAGLRRRLGERFEPHPFGGWLLVEGRGPFGDDRTVLIGVYHSLLAARESISGESEELARYFSVTLSTLCGSVRGRWGDPCPLRFPG